MIRILHAIGTSDLGGTERFLVRLLEGLDRARFTSDVCVLDAPGPLAPEYRRAARSVHHLDARPVRAPAVLWSWWNILRESQPHVIVLYGARANLLGRTFRLGTPVITALRSTFVDEHGSAAAARIDKLTFRRVSVCISNSRVALQELGRRGYPADRLAYIPNGIDVSAFATRDRLAARLAYGVAPELAVLICVANLKRVKGHDVLLKASAGLKRAGLPHEVWLLGEGPERPRLEALARALTVDGTTRFLGIVGDVPSRLAAADVFVMPSRWEGTPTALLEAMAAGLPAIATTVGDIPVVLEDGAVGSLVAPDDPEGLQTAVEDLLRSPERRRTLGERARRTAERYSMTHVVEQYEAAFEWAARRGAPAELHRIIGALQGDAVESTPFRKGR